MKARRYSDPAKFKQKLNFWESISQGKLVYETKQRAVVTPSSLGVSSVALKFGGAAAFARIGTQGRKGELPGLEKEQSSEENGDAAPKSHEGQQQHDASSPKAENGDQNGGDHPKSTTNGDHPKKSDEGDNVKAVEQSSVDNSNSENQQDNDEKNPQEEKSSHHLEEIKHHTMHVKAKTLPRGYHMPTQVGEVHEETGGGEEEEEEQEAALEVSSDDEEGEEGERGEAGGEGGGEHARPLLKPVITDLLRRKRGATAFEKVLDRDHLRELRRFYDERDRVKEQARDEHEEQLDEAAAAVKEENPEEVVGGEGSQPSDQPEPDKPELTEEEKAALEEKERKRLEHRSRVLGEIVESERNYCNGLTMLVTHFVHPLKGEEGSSFGISQADTAGLFSNVELIHTFHLTFLKELEVAYKDNRDDIPRVISKYCDFFKQYNQYLNSYDGALGILNSLRNSKAFNKFLEQKRVVCQGQSLMSLLILPVQRIPRYEMLLREVKRVTKPDHSTYPSLEEAFSKVCDIAVKLNEDKRQAENMSKLMEIQLRIAGDESSPLVFGSLIQSHRRIIREADLRQLREDKSSKLRKFYLFNDLLLWTSPDKTGLAKAFAAVQFKGSMHLSGASVKSLEGNPAGFTVETHERYVDIECKDEAEAKALQGEIKGVIEVLTTARAKLRAQKMLKRRQGDNSHHQRENMTSKILQSLSSFKKKTGDSTDSPRTRINSRLGIVSEEDVEGERRNSM